jgi:hypothetical protein
MAENKKRHGCLTAWLVFMIIVNSACAAIMYYLGNKSISLTVPEAPEWAFLALIALSLFNLACAIALFKWKKWGFWGFCISSIIALFTNLSIGLGIGSSISGVFGILILYGILHIGKENKGWPQLD